jgi:ABC-type dipeptide/oligopeptide/nickel transport system ATPase subunit
MSNGILPGQEPRIIEPGTKLKTFKLETLSREKSVIGSSFRLTSELKRIIFNTIQSSNWHANLLGTMSYNSHICKNGSPLCSQATMLPSDLRKELARQTMGFMAWALSHTTLGIFCSWTVTIWGMLSLLTGFVNFLVRARQLCNSRHPDVNINMFHIILTVFQTIDQSFNPLNLVRSSIKRAIVQLTSSNQDHDLKLEKLLSEVFALKIKVRHLEMFNNSGNQDSEHHYERMLPTLSQPRDLNDTFFLTNQALPDAYSVPRRSAHVSPYPSFKTADQIGQMSADLKQVLTAVGAQTEVAARIVQEMGSNTNQTLRGKLATPSDSSAELDSLDKAT